MKLKLTRVLRGFSRWDVVFVTIFFSALTLLLHYKVVAQFSKCVIAGQQVGSYYSWVFWWRKYALQHGLPMFYTHHIMYPGGTLIWPHAPLIEVLALLLQMFTTPWAALNAIFISNYICAAVASYILFYSISRESIPSVCGAFAYAFSQFMLVQHFHGHINESAIYFAPLFALSLIRFRETPCSKTAFWVGCSLTGIVLSTPTLLVTFVMIFCLAFFTYDVFFDKARLVKAAAGSRFWLALFVPMLVCLLVYWQLLGLKNMQGESFFYTQALSSFITPPSWHSSALVRLLTLKSNAVVFPEMSMSYLGLGTLLFIAYGFVQKLWKETSFQLWLWIFFVAFVFNLGPWLYLTPDMKTPIPLPFALILKCPILSNYRTPARIMSVVSLASSALLVLSLRRFFIGKPRWVAVLTGALLMGFAIWEFDIPAPLNRVLPAQAPPVYDTVKNDPERFAILELPITYSPNGDIYSPNGDFPIYAQVYMLFQIYHEKPMVLGFPARHEASALDFTEKSDVVYELVHPSVLPRLDTEPALWPRAEWMRHNGSRVLKEDGIKYVVYHRNLKVLPPLVTHSLESWLKKMFGEPIAADAYGNCLYRTG
jgi:hypothetical protein